MSGRERRCERQPGLFLAAHELCVTDLTNGFCSPKQVDSCQCWDKAEQMLRGSGLSCQAIAWLYRNRKRVEEEAEKVFGSRGISRSEG